MTVELNISRLRYLLSLYKMEDSDLLDIINRGLKRKYSYGQVFTEKIDVRILKKIDKLLFSKGLTYYVDPAPIQPSEGMSVFFRKKSFSEDLNFTSRKVVNDYESLKNFLASLDTLSNVKTEIKIPHCAQKTSARIAAEKVRAIIYPEKTAKMPRDFLKSLIGNLADAGILVFEYIEAPRKKEKANIDGFFLRPNFIVLKRYSYYKREIFTLLHELGHCVLDKEEVESLNAATLDYSAMSSVERWCNDFAYYFLVGTYADDIDKIAVADGTNDYQFPLIDKLSQKCHISRRALFTRLFYTGKINKTDYNNVIEDLDERYALWLASQKAAAKDENGERRRMAPPQPIYSPKFLSTLSIALHDGTVRPAELYRMSIPTKVVEGLRKWW